MGGVVCRPSRATGMSRRTIQRGLAELGDGADPGAGRLRRAGAGREALTEADPTLLVDLDALLEPATRGDPERPLRWTSKSAARLADGLREQGHEIVGRSVLRLLAGIGYTMQANRKTQEGSDHPDRDAQFEHISNTVAVALQAGQPVISGQSTPKRRSWSETSRPWGASGRPQASPWRSTRTTSPATPRQGGPLRHL
jgi:hypothetical protein